ncbi:hypothetical protein JIG36_40590 [Actinoplanes sp. LDG1-06]|uniref:Uncharacterized protein n=1 Tax=Paractinoplanes ovalisporus TaxID=2810368 RepID=A0ABS2APN6_9ACTN|nr:hypothetical protein [Actinoplanes ovalisporus]MBM2621822.1 hypothetical protein [Actinoplanes ovalisporus]
MPGRPRPPHGDDGDSRPSPRPRPVRHVAEGQETAGEFLQAGRVRSEPADRSGATPATRPEDAELNRVMEVYEQLGNEPPAFNIARNDEAFSDPSEERPGAHTLDRHGPDIPLRGDPSVKTVEGRIYGHAEWDHAANWSLRWTDHTTMNREVNNYVRENWEQIRSNLALQGSHSGAFNAGHRVGEGFFNNGMFGAGPREAQYTAASMVRVSINLVPGSDPPQPFVVTAFPAGDVPFGLL